MQVNWVFGDDANYDSASDSYTLTDTVEVNALDYLYNNASEKIENSHHYTCFNSSNVCKNNYSSYVFYFSDDKLGYAA